MSGLGMWTKPRNIAARKSSGMVLKSYYRLTQKRATSKAKGLMQTACSRAGMVGSRFLGLVRMAQRGGQY